MVRIQWGTLIVGPLIGADATQSTLPNCDIQREDVGGGTNWVTGYPDTGIGRCESSDKQEDYVQKCSDFCGDNTVPLTIGMKTTGLNYVDFKRICLGLDLPVGEEDTAFMTAAPQKLKDCKRIDSSLDQLILSTSQFISQWDSVKVDQAAYKGELTKAAAEIRRQLNEEWLDSGRIGSAGRSTKIDMLQEVLSDLINQELNSNGMAKKNLEDNVRSLIATGNNLKVAVGALSNDIDTMINDCLGVMPIVTKNDVFLFDICGTESEECLQENQPDGYHVGCCCGTVPGVGSVQAAATGSSTFSQGTGGGRRLTGQSTACELATQKTLDHLASVQGANFVTDNTDAVEGLKLIEDHFKSLAECDGGRRLSKKQMPQQQETAAISPVPEAEVPSFRRLNQGICPTRPDGQFGYTAGDPFKLMPTQSKHVEKCMDIAGSEMETESTEILNEECNKFCMNAARDQVAIPIPVGNTRTGFSHEQMDKICLSPAGTEAVHRYNATHLSMCHSIITNQKDLHTAIVAFEVALEKVQVTKTEAEVAIKETVETLKRNINENAEKTLDNTPFQLVRAKFMEMINVAKVEFDRDDNIVKKKLRLKLADLKVRADQMVTKLESFGDNTERFLNECDGMFTGVDSTDHYLLDQCASRSGLCLKDDFSERVGCCCGYIPLTRYGSDNLDMSGTIPGVDALTFPGGRRMSSPSIASVCSDVAKEMQPFVLELVDEFNQMGDVGFDLTPYKDAAMLQYCPEENNNNNNVGGNGNEVSSENSDVSSENSDVSSENSDVSSENSDRSIDSSSDSNANSGSADADSAKTAGLQVVIAAGLLGHILV